MGQEVSRQSSSAPRVLPPVSQHHVGVTASSGTPVQPAQPIDGNDFVPITCADLQYSSGVVYTTGNVLKQIDSVRARVRWCVRTLAQLVLDVYYLNINISPQFLDDRHMRWEFVVLVHHKTILEHRENLGNLSASMAIVCARQVANAKPLSTYISPHSAETGLALQTAQALAQPVAAASQTIGNSVSLTTLPAPHASVSAEAKHPELVRVSPDPAIAAESAVEAKTTDVSNRFSPSAESTPIAAAAVSSTTEVQEDEPSPKNPPPFLSAPSESTIKGLAETLFGANEPEAPNSVAGEPADATQPKPTVSATPQITSSEPSNEIPPLPNSGLGLSRSVSQPVSENSESKLPPPALIRTVSISVARRLTALEFYGIYIFLHDRRPPASMVMSIAEDESKTPESTATTGSNPDTSCGIAESKDASGLVVTQTTTEIVVEAEIKTTAPSEPEEDDSLCTICFVTEVEVSLPCAHTYCQECIEDWYLRDPSCPHCRQSLVPDDRGNPPLTSLFGQPLKFRPPKPVESTPSHYEDEYYDDDYSYHEDDYADHDEDREHDGEEDRDRDNEDQLSQHSGDESSHHSGSVSQTPQQTSWAASSTSPSSSSSSSSPSSSSSSSSSSPVNANSTTMSVSHSAASSANLADAINEGWDVVGASDITSFIYETLNRLNKVMETRPCMRLP